MTESAILGAAFAAVETWAKAAGGKATPAEDPQHAIDLLVAGASGGLVAAVYWVGDQGAGEDGVIGDPRLDGTFAVALLRAVGLKPRGSEHGTMLDLAAGARTAVLRDMPGNGLLGGPEYTGKTPLSAADGRLLNGYVLRFKVHYAFAFQEMSHG